MTAIVPLNQLQRRAPEAGRIRLGVKTAKAMKSIDTFRFTSVHKDAIERLAELYGGTPEPWSEPKAAPNQWQVITTSSKIEVLAEPGGCTTWYEQWAGGGCARRCDGEICEIPGRDEMQEVACICAHKGVAECDPYTRLSVVLPELDFYGVWRLQTKGWNAAKELPGMFDMVVALATAGRMVKAHLHLEQRKQVKNGQTKNFVVPVITVAASPNELLAGGGVARPQLGGGGHAELGPAPNPDSALTFDEVEEAGLDGTLRDMVDADIIDAEIVDPEEGDRLEGIVRDIAAEHKHDPSTVVAVLWRMTDGDHAKIQKFIDKSKQGKALGFTGTGNLTWRSS